MKKIWPVIITAQLQVKNTLCLMHYSAAMAWIQLSFASLSNKEWVQPVSTICITWQHVTSTATCVRCTTQQQVQNYSLNLFYKSTNNSFHMTLLRFLIYKPLLFTRDLWRKLWWTLQANCTSWVLVEEEGGSVFGWCSCHYASISVAKGGGAGLPPCMGEEYTQDLGQGKEPRMDYWSGTNTQM